MTEIHVFSFPTNPKLLSTIQTNANPRGRYAHGTTTPCNCHVTDRQTNWCLCCSLRFVWGMSECWLPVDGISRETEGNRSDHGEYLTPSAVYRWQSVWVIMHPILPGPAGYRGSPDGCHRSDLSCPPARGVLHSHQSAGHQDRYMFYEGEREKEREKWGGTRREKEGD